MQIKVVGLAGYVALGMISQSNLLHAQEANPAKEAQTAPKPALEWHFAGFDRINELRELNYRQILDLAESRALRETTVQKLASYSAAQFMKGGPETNRTKIAELVQPLLRSSMESETRLEVRSSTDGNVNWVFGIRTGNRALWSTNLWQLASHARQKPTATNLNGAIGWSSTVPGKNYHLSLWNQRDWLYIAGGAQRSTEQDPFSGKRLSGQKGTLFQGHFDLPQLARMFDQEKLAGGPTLSLIVEPRGNALRSELNLKYPHELGIKPETWNIPTNSIKDPIVGDKPGLIGFTAMQGTARLFEKNQKLKDLGVHQNPNQLFLWADSLSPFSISFALPIGNAVQFLKNFSETTVPDLNEKVQGKNLGNIMSATNNSRLLWRGLPIIVPFLVPGSGNDSKFLVGGLFPLSNPITNPAPAELFQQVTSKKNLVYYDWEITEARLAQWRPLSQLYMILSDRPLKAAEAPGEVWLNQVQPFLGNTITEATLVSPTELQVTRRSDMGLNALELVMFTEWLDNPSFPNWSRPRVERPTNSVPRVLPGPKGVPAQRKPAAGQKKEQPLPSPL